MALLFRHCEAQSAEAISEEGELSLLSFYSLQLFLNYYSCPKILTLSSLNCLIRAVFGKQVLVPGSAIKHIISVGFFRGRGCLVDYRLEKFIGYLHQVFHGA